MDLIKPKEIEIKDGEGNIKTFILSKFSAWDGRKIVALYPMSNLPKLGDYNVSEEVAELLMTYVAVPTPNGHQRLSTRALVNNHVPDFESLLQLEMAMMEYNCSFFRNGTLSAFLERIAQTFLAKITETLTQSAQQSSQTNEQPSTNSEQSTT